MELQSSEQPSQSEQQFAIKHRSEADGSVTKNWKKMQTSIKWLLLRSSVTVQRKLKKKCFTKEHSEWVKYCFLKQYFTHALRKTQTKKIPAIFQRSRRIFRRLRRFWKIIRRWSERRTNVPIIFPKCPKIVKDFDILASEDTEIRVF